MRPKVKFLNDTIIEKIQLSGKIVKKIIIQEMGSIKSINSLIVQYLAEIRRFLSRQKREYFELSRLVVGLECGASDSFSGITANPCVGRVSDKLVKHGATVMISEIPEMIGAKNILKNKKTASNTPSA